MVVDKQTVMRIWHTFRLWMIPDSGKRAVYIRKHKLFHRVGKGCTIMERKIPLYPQMISLGDNVHLASKVSLVTHDAIHLCLNGLYMCEGGVLHSRKRLVVLRLAIMFLLVLIRPCCMM